MKKLNRAVKLAKELRGILIYFPLLNIYLVRYAVIPTNGEIIKDFTNY